MRREVKAFAQAHGALDADAVALALSEVLTNAVLHAYVGSDPGPVEVQVERLVDDGLRIVVSDSGRGLTPRHDSPGLGLGLPLVAALADDVDVTTAAGAGTRLCMTFAAA